MGKEDDKAKAGLSGRLVQWDDPKGFGWAESQGKRFFVHIKEFGARARRRPVIGEEIRFVAGTDSQGRACAKDVSFVKEGGRRSWRMGWGAWLALVLLLILPAFAWLLMPYPVWWIPSWIGGASVVTALMYWSDKRKAERREWRIPETSLHVAELIGGWPGAFLAQRMLRHKIAKTSYQFVYWVIVLLYQIVALDVFLGGRILRWVIGLVK